VYLTRREITSDGLEKVWVVHYLASFIINYRLMDKLRAQDGPGSSWWARKGIALPPGA
jgi:hypothetical protein